MSKIVEIKLDETERWDTIVRSFEEYDVYYLNGYVRAFWLHGDGEPVLCYYEGNGVRGMNVIMKRDIAKDSHFTGKLEPDTYFDATTPYGYGGWLFEGEGDIREALLQYEAWCRKNSIICEFVRFHPILENQKKVNDFYQVIPLGETVAMDLISPEIIWKNITSKNRNMIRKSQKNGIKIYNGRYPEIFRIFKDIYNQTMDKDHAEHYYYFGNEFYESILNDLPQQAQVFYAQAEDGTIIAASIMLSANGKMNYHLSGSLREYQHLAPTNLLLYEAALWGSSNGYKSMHLGGGVGSASDSLLEFKKSFYRGDLHRYNIGKRIIDEEKYKQLIEMRNGQISDIGFFPIYRAK